MVANYEEEREQRALVKWFKMQYARYEKLLFHIPNGQNVGPRVGARLKSIGLQSGVPDLFLAIPSGKYCGLFIEMKSKSGRLQKEQKNMQSLIRGQRYQVNTCYSFDEAALVIKEYLNEKQ